jgi:predicted permease
MNFLTSLISVGLLIALAAPGYILRKLKMLPNDFIDGLVTLLLYVAVPFLVISAFIETPFSRTLVFNMAAVITLAFVQLTASYAVCRLCFSFKKDTAARKVCIAGGFLNNAAFMGIPLMQVLFPGNPEPILFVSMFTVAFNLTSWTLLVYTITGDKKYIRIKAAVINPGTISFLIALALQFFRVRLPVPAVNAMHFFANMTTPLSMMVMGIRLADIRFRELFQSLNVYLSVFVKLILAPLTVLGILLLVKRFIPLDIDMMIYKTLFILSAMPSASYVIVFSEKFNADRITAVKCVLLSSVFCIITIPIMMLFINAFG